MANVDYQLEEYKLVLSRIETHDNRYYQMLILSFTGFATILGLGFSDKVSKEFIPFMINPFILITSIIALHSSLRQGFERAYLIEVFENNVNSIKHEITFIKIFKKTITASIIKWLRPFVIINLLGIASSIYFGWGKIICIGLKSIPFFCTLVLYLITTYEFYRTKKMKIPHFTEQINTMVKD